MATTKLESEADVKKLVKQELDALDAWSFMPVSNGMGKHGIPDHIACVPVKITEDMVGMTIGQFVAIEAKRPGRRHEDNRGATQSQVDNLTAIDEAGGIAMIADGPQDLEALKLCFQRSFSA